MSGQLNLLDILAKAELRQLNQRISIRCSLKALTREEVEAYVTHRLWVARGSTPVTFTPKAFDLVHSISGGVPRVINLLCDRALMVGCEQQTSRITEDHIVGAAAQLGQEIPKGKIMGEGAVAGAATPASRRAGRLAIGAAILAAVALATYVLLGNPVDLMSAGPAPASPPRPAPVLAEPLVALPSARGPAGRDADPGIVLAPGWHV